MEYSLSQFGSILKRLNLKGNISYGSGGFCIVLRDMNGAEYSGFSWDISEAFEIAKNKFAVTEEFSNEDTAVDFRKNNRKH